MTTQAPTIRERSSSVATGVDKTHDGSQSTSLILAYLAPIVVGAIVRAVVAFGWFGQAEFQNDAADYYSEATKLYTGTREAIPFYWPPGTSYYLAGWYSLFGNSVTATRIAIIVLSTLQIGIVGLLTQQAIKAHRVAILASWLWAFYPPSVFLVFQPYSQHLAGLSLAVIALSGIRWLKTQSRIWVVAFGCSVGIGCLTRPSMMTVAALSGLCIFLFSIIQSGSWSKRILSTATQCLLFIASSGIVLAPSILHNSNTGGGYTLSTNNERNFFLGNNPYTPWYKTSHFAQRTLDELSPEVQTYLRSMYEAPDRRNAMARAAMDHIRENPGLAALRTVNRARAFWGFDYLASRVIQTGGGSKVVSAIVLLAEAGGYCAVMLLSFVTIVYWIGRVQGLTLGWYLAVVLAYAAPYCLAFSGGTYHFPVVGVMIPLAAMGIHILQTNGIRQTFRSWSLLTVVVLFMAIQLEYAYFTLAAGITRTAQVQPVDTQTSSLIS